MKRPSKTSHLYQLEQMYPHRHFQLMQENKSTNTNTYLMEWRKYCRTYIVFAYCRRHAPIGFNKIKRVDIDKIINAIFGYFQTPYFVKIQKNPTFKSITKQLTRPKLRGALEKDLILPLAVKRNFKDYKSNNFNVEQYDFESHVTLQTIALSAIQNKQLNSRYFEETAADVWKFGDKKSKMLDLAIRMVQIVQKMSESNLADFNLRAHDFIIKTKKNGAFNWEDVRSDNCFKVGHGMMSKIKGTNMSMDKLSGLKKDCFVPPEMMSDNDGNIDIEAFNVYQLSTILCFVLLGQVQKDGIWYTLCLNEGGKIVDEALGFDPNLHIRDEFGLFCAVYVFIRLFPLLFVVQYLVFLKHGVSESPSKRPSLSALLDGLMKAKECINPLYDLYETGSFKVAIAEKVSAGTSVKELRNKTELLLEGSNSRKTKSAFNNFVGSFNCITKGIGCDCDDDVDDIYSNFHALVKM